MSGETPLSDSELHLMRQCPQRLFVLRKSRPTSNELGKLRMVQKLQQAGLINGRLDIAASNEHAHVMVITLTNAGRRALGLVVEAQDGQR